MNQSPSRNGEGNHPEAAAFHEWWKKQGLAGEEHSVKRWSAWNGWLARSALPSETETTPGNVELLKLGDRAKRIMKDKQSYDCHIDPRVAAEYERAYALVQDLADRWGTMSSNRQGEAK